MTLSFHQCKMKNIFPKLLVLALCALLLSPCAHGASLPESFSFSSSDSLRSPSIFAERCATPPILDGSASSCEYGRTTSFSHENGLFLCTNGGASVSDSYLKTYEGAVSTVGICYDNEYFYFAVTHTLPEGSYRPYMHPTYGEVCSFSVSFSLEDGEDFAARHAALENSYFFTPSMEMKAVVGTRLRYEGGKLKNALQISSSSQALKENGYRSENGEIWNGERYCKEAWASVNENKTQICFECRIPIGDVLLCLSEDKREEAYSRLMVGEAFSASFMTRSSWCASSDTALLASTGIPTESPYYFDESVSWKEALVTEHGINTSVACAIDYLMPPVCFGSATETDREQGSADQKVPTGTSKAPSASREETIGSEDEKSENKDEFGFDLPPITEEDESVFDDLPEENEALPEDTEIVPVESEYEDGETSLLGSLLPLLIALFMIFAVIVAAFVFFRLEKQEKNAQKSKKKQ